MTVRDEAHERELDMAWREIISGERLARTRLAIVHRDFHSESKLDRLRSFPYHMESPVAHITARCVLDAHSSGWRAPHSLKELRR